MRIDVLEEPELEFGDGNRGKDPRRCLAMSGPFGGTMSDGVASIPLGVVGPATEIEPVLRWIESMRKFMMEDETNVARFHEFPGIEKAFNCKFDVPVQFVRILDNLRFSSALAQSPQRRFTDLLELYHSSIRSLFGDQRPATVLVCFPEEVANLRVTNPKLSFQQQRMLERLQAQQDSQQIDLFDQTLDDKKAASELLPQADELLFRSFHRALKAVCMTDLNCVPIQVLRRHTYVNSEAKQSSATRAWNLSVALYYKSGGIPWRPTNLDSGACFIGVSFHHLKRRSGDIVYASVAQAFSTQTEPFALKGTPIPPEQTRHKRPFLTEEQAASLVTDTLNAYRDRTGSFPSKVVVHKTSQYEPEEREGFRGAVLANSPACELISLSPTGFRLLKRGMVEPARGTLCTIADRSHYLFTTGYVSWWREYPGPHIPAPLELWSDPDSDIRERAREILSLTKMNWNSADGIGRYPITLTFARRVGITMTEIEDNQAPNPLYRFYM